MKKLLSKAMIKRALSLALIFALTLTSFCFFDFGILKADATIDVENEQKTQNDVAFYAPEAIYLAPNRLSWRDSTTANFQYAVVNAVDESSIYTNPAAQATTVTIGDAEKPCYVYFAHSGISGTPKIAYRYLDTNGNAISGGSVAISALALMGNYWRATVTGGTSPSLAAATTGCYLEWTASYTDSSDGLAKTVTQYTYIYKPYTVPVVGATLIINNDTGVRAGSYLTLAGFHSISGEAERYGNADTIAAFLSGANGGTSQAFDAQFNECYGGNDENNDNYDPGDLSNTGTQYSVKNFGYQNETPGKGRVYGNLAVAAKGVINIDRSRYSNLNQLPNLGTSYTFSNCYERSDEHGMAYLCDYTGRTSTVDGRDMFDTWTFTEGQSYDVNSTYYNDYGTKLYNEGNGTDGSDYDCNVGQKYQGGWNAGVAETNSSYTYALKSFVTTYRSKKHACSMITIQMTANQTDRSALRTAVQNASKAMADFGINGTAGAMTSHFYEGSTYSGFVTNYKNALKYLTSVDGNYTQATIDSAVTALNNSVTALKNGADLKSGTATIIHKSISGNIMATETKEYKYFQTVTAAANSYTGYTCQSIEPAETELTNVVSDPTWTITYKPNTYTITYNGNGATSGSTASSSYTYDEETALRSNGFTKAYTITFDANATTGNTAVSGMPDSSVLIGASQFKGWNTESDGTGTPYAGGASVTNPFGADNGTLYAIWEGGDITLPSPVRNGYIFGGWYKDADCKTFAGDANATYTSASDETLYAKWTADEYTIAYNGNGATSGSTDNIKYNYDTPVQLAQNGFTREYTITLDANVVTGNTNVTGITSPLKSVYSFDKWNTRADGSGIAYAAGATVTNIFNTNVGTLYAIWRGGSVTLPTPEREGYTFGGWYKELACTNKVNTSYTATSDITLYAKWTANTYSIVYNANGGSGNTTRSTHTYDLEKALTTNAFLKTGSKFLGWNTQADGSGTFYKDCQLVKNLTAENGESITLYAQWEAIVYTINYDANGATSGETASTTYLYGVPTILAENGFKREYTVTYDANAEDDAAINGLTASAKSVWKFRSWNKSPDGSNIAYDSGATVTNPFGTTGGTLYAVWDEGYITLPNLTRTGYNFGGWYLDSACLLSAGGAGSAYNATEDVTLYAKWTPKNYMVIFSPNGGSVSLTSKQVAYGNAYGELPLPSKAGYEFLGWYTASTGGEKITADTIVTLTANQMLYAQWKRGDITVSFSGNGATSGTMADQIFEYDVAQMLSINTFKREYTVTLDFGGIKENEELTAIATFNGWQYNGSILEDGASAQFTQNTTLMAEWTLDSVTLPTPDDTEDYYAIGWTSAKNSTVAEYECEETLNAVGRDMTLYAVWKSKEVTVTFDANGGEVDAKTTTVIADKAYGELPVPTRTNYNFIGWALDGEIVTADTIVTKRANHKLVAQWTPMTCTVTFDAAGGTVEIESMEVSIVGTYGELPTPTKEHYSFGGWMLPTEEIVTEDTIVKTAGDHTLKAKWNPDEIVVTFHAIGATGGSMEPQTFYYRVAQALNKNQFVREHTVTLDYAGLKENETIEAPAKFTHWTSSYLQGDVLIYRDFANGEYTIVEETDTDLYANWELASVTLPMVEDVEGYTFLGWTIDDGSVILYNNGNVVREIGEDIKLTAVWQENHPSKVIDVTYTPSTEYLNTFNIKVEGRADKVQLVEPTGGTRTYHRQHDRVTIVSYNAAGEVIDSLARDVAYEIWSINCSLPEMDMTAKAKFGKVWDTNGYSFTVELLPPEMKPVDDTVYEMSLAAEYGRPGIVMATVITGTDVQSVQFVMEDKSTTTYSKATAQLVDGKLVFTGKTYMTHIRENVITVRIKSNNVWKDAGTLTYVAE